MQGVWLAALISLLCHSIANAGKEAAAAVCITSERDALLAFKAGLCADSAGELPSWQGHDCCSWGSVSCNKRTGHVIGLDIGQYALSFTGEINSSLAALTHLRYLNLSGNDFGGVAIPDFIGSFSKLRHLDLSHAGFAGLVPPQLGNLSMLSHLALNSSTIRMDNFHWVSRLRALRYLDLGRLYLVACSDWLQAISSLPLLQVLRLNDAFLPRWIWSLHSLSYLDLSSCQLSGSVPDNIGNLSSLSFLQLLDNHLDLSYNAFGGRLSEVHLGNLSRLDFLSLASNKLKIVIEPNWMPTFQLTGLGLHGCHVGPHIPAWLRSQTKIKMIDLGSTKITGTLPDWLWNFSSSITTLDISSQGRAQDFQLGYSKLEEIENFFSTQV